MSGLKSEVEGEEVDAKVKRRERRGYEKRRDMKKTIEQQRR